jgi:hypothetical protein
MLEDYKNSLEKIKNSANAVYSKLTFMTIAELLESDLNLHGLWMKMADYWESANKLYGVAIDSLEGMEYGPEFDSLESEIEDTYRETTNKLDAIQDLINSLEKILETEEDEGITKHFQDIKTINI